MKKFNWYRFTFENGHVIIAKGMSAHEMKIAVRDNGKLISKEYYGYY